MQTKISEEELASKWARFLLICHLLQGFINPRKALNVHSRCQKIVDLVWVPAVRYKIWEIKMHILLYRNVQSSILCNSPKLETTNTHTNSWRVKQVEVSPYSIPLSKKKKRHQAVEMCDRMDGCQSTYVEKEVWQQVHTAWSHFNRKCKLT